MTNDVNFAELAAALDETGTAITLRHGNALANRIGQGSLVRGHGVFLGELGLLEPADDPRRSWRGCMSARQRSSSAT